MGRGIRFRPLLLACAIVAFVVGGYGYSGFRCMGGAILVSFDRFVADASIMVFFASAVVAMFVIFPTSIIRLAADVRQRRQFDDSECIRCGHPLTGNKCSECGWVRVGEYEGWSPSLRTVAMLIIVTGSGAFTAIVASEIVMRWEERRFIAEVAHEPLGTWIQQDSLLGSDLIRRADGTIVRDD